MEVLNDLLGYKNRKIYQNTDWFSFSLDSVLLSHFVTVLPSVKNILDLGTGTAPIPLILSLKTKAKITALEIQSEVSALAKKSISYNNLENQIEIVNCDMKDYAKQVDSDSFDVITCNPPYFKYNNDSFVNNNKIKSLARHEIMINLEEIFQIARKLLKNDGVFAIVHRTERFVELMELFRKYNLEPKKIQFVYPKKSKTSNIVLIEGVKNGKVGLKVLPPLFIHREDNSYSEEYFSMLE